MCGISGFITKKNSSNNLKILKDMVSSLSHRGPDNKGYWSDVHNKQFLGHSRLSILDLSQNGNQPMISSSGRYIISYNGEIYNHLEIREKIRNIKKVIWKSTSDTETILEAIEIYGLKKTISILHGMFSMCIIDKKKSSLFLIRDKYGEKPLYYGFSNSTFLFGSELKSIISYPNFEKKINYKSLNYFFSLSYIPEPFSIFENISKILPGTILNFNLNDHKVLGYEYYDTICNKDETEFKNSNLSDEFDKLINTVVKDTLISDVEVGSFLSGGLDSSLITSVMQKQSLNKIKTFSVVFDDNKFDEKFYSRNISEYLNTDHNELLLKSKDLIDASKIISDVYDEPFADSSQIPTILISKFASKKVKVILSGDGADEFYGGYSRYIGFSKIDKLMPYCPFSFRFFLGKIISKLPYELLTNMEITLGKIFKHNRSITQLDDKIKKLGNILINSKNITDMYYSIISLSENTINLLKNENSKDQIIEMKDKISTFFNKKNSLVENVMLADQNMYLTGDILHKVDRASMHYSLETRVPFLNPKIINFSKKIDQNMKIDQGKGKVLLRDVLKKYIPSQFVDRPKMGFSIPINNWLRGPLREWGIRKLDFKKIKDQNLLNEDQIQFYLTSHMSGKNDYSKELWNLIVFQSWVEKYT